MEIVAIANQKGGCGKTTTAVNLAAALGKRGKRILLVDMDPQGHASLGLGQRSEDRPGLYEVFLREVTIGEVIIPDAAKGVDLVPGTISLAAVEHLLADTAEREWRLASHLAQLEGQYDFAVIDCPPSLGLLSFNALRAADRVVVPVELSAFSLDGLDRLSETIELLAERYKTEIPITIVPTMVDQRPRFTRDMLRSLRDAFDDAVAQSCIHYTVRLKEAALSGMSIFAHEPKGMGAMDYDRLARELMGEQVGRVTVTAFAGRKSKAAGGAKKTAGAKAGKAAAAGSGKGKAARAGVRAAPAAEEEWPQDGSGDETGGAGPSEDETDTPWDADDDGGVAAAPKAKGRAATRWADAEVERAAMAAFAAPLEVAPGASGTTRRAASKGAGKAPGKATGAAPKGKAQAVTAGAGRTRHADLSATVRAAAAPKLARVSDVDRAARAAAAADPAPTLREVILNFGKASGRRVQVAGDFNDWIPDRGVSTRKDKNKVQKVLKLRPGAYQYRVIVDGVWQEDPGNPERVPNIYGGQNSLLQVEPPAGPSPT